MMRLSSSIQINLDVGDEDTMIERWLVGNLLAPVMTAIFGNSPFFGREMSGAKSYRSLIWQNLDKTRAGVVGNLSAIKTRKDIESAYFSFAMDAKVILLPDEAGKIGFQSNQISFREWNRTGVNGIYPKFGDWENHLTTLFPEVRPKGFFEFRYIDGQSRIWWLAPVIMLSRLLYDSKARQRVIELLLPYADHLSDMQWKASIMGIAAFPDICGQIAALSLRSDRFSLDDLFLEYLERFSKMYPLRGKNPADDLLSLNCGNVFTVSQFQDYETRLLECIASPEDVLLLYRSDGVHEKKIWSDTNPTHPVDRSKLCC